MNVEVVAPFIGWGLYLLGGLVAAGLLAWTVTEPGEPAPRIDYAAFVTITIFVYPLVMLVLLVGVALLRLHEVRDARFRGCATMRAQKGGSDGRTRMERSAREN